MNKLTFLLSVVMSVAVSPTIIAQKTAFEKIEFASFDINSPRTTFRDSVAINLFSTIDSRGVVKVLNDDTYHETLTFYTYKLNTDQLKKIHSVFNNVKRLKEYMVIDKLEENSFFAGNYQFLSIEYKNGARDSLCFVPPFMAQEFLVVLEMLDSIYYGEKETKKIMPFLITPHFRNTILAAYKKSSYLPTIRFPPAFRKED